MQKALLAEKKKLNYLEKQKEKLGDYHSKKKAEEDKKKRQEEKEKAKKEMQKKKLLKEQEMKKKQIAEYKMKKLEAEEMLANADIPEYEETTSPFYGSTTNTNKGNPGLHGAVSGYFGMSNKNQPDDEEEDEEDKYLDEIISKNYGGKAPPAVN